MIDRRLKLLRESKNLSQKDLAYYLGVSPSTIGMYESNKRTPDVDMLNRIADYFNVTVDYLLGRTNIRNYENKIDLKSDVIALTFENFDSNDFSKDDLDKIENFIKFILYENT